MGLAMVRTLVELMGGTICILDKTGPGTLFRFDLSLERNAGMAGLSGSNTPQAPFDTPRASSDAETDKARVKPDKKEPTISRLACTKSEGDPAVEEVMSAVKKPPELSLKDSEGDGIELPLTPTVLEGSAVLLLKGDRVGREAAAGWMRGRGLRVYEAARWVTMEDTLKRVLEGREPIDVAGEEADMGGEKTVKGVNGHVKSREIIVTSDDFFGASEDGSEASESDIKPRDVLMILDTSLVPGSPSPDAIWAAFTSVMRGFDLTAPDAPRVAVSWLVSIAVPGAVREEMRTSGCQIMVVDLLHLSRLLSLLTTMVSNDLAIHDSLLNGCVGSSERLDTMGSSNHGGRNGSTEEERFEVMIQAGVAFTSGRGVVDERGPGPEANSSPGKDHTVAVPNGSIPPDVSSTSLRTVPSLPELETPGVSSPSRFGRNEESGKERGGNDENERERERNESSGEKERKEESTKADERNGEGGKEKERGEENEKATEQKEESGKRRGSKGPLGGIHNLVVEDTVLLRKLAVSILTKLGAEVIAVDDGRQVS
jgi:hypothetical protein